MHYKVHTEEFTVWPWTQTYMRKREGAWQCDGAVMLLIIQKVFRAMMSQKPL